MLYLYFGYSFFGFFVLLATKGERGSHLWNVKKFLTLFLSRLLVKLLNFWAFDIWKIGAMIGLIFALTFRFFACGFFGETESCFNAYDKSWAFSLGGGVAGRFSNCHIAGGGGKLKGSARSVGRF
jgi:hypothetical protein